MVGPLREELKVLGIHQPDRTATHLSHQPVEGATAGGSSISSRSRLNPGPSSSTAADHSGSLGSSSVAAAAANSRNVFRQPAILGVCLKPRPCVMISVQLPNSHRAARIKSQKDRLDFWREYGHGTLPTDALVCLATPGQALVFATVVRRDTKELAEEQPMIGLAFEPGQDVERIISLMGKGPLPATVLVQVSGSCSYCKFTA